MASAPTSQHPDTDAAAAESAAAGKAAREEVPRSSHGEWEPAKGRKDPVKLLESQAKSRVPELVPIRYGRMLASPFTFYRGTAAIMAMDLAKTPQSGFRVQACGDAHLSNFGIFAAPDRSLILDVNDFDETLPGPWEWDVKRLAASFEIAGRDREFTAEGDPRRRPPHRARVPRGDAGIRRDGEPRRLVRPTGRRIRDRGLGEGRRSQADEGGQEERRKGP